jgi:type III secretory pathway component EscV
MLKSLGAQRLLALFLVGCGLLNFPLLALWTADVTVWGIPLFPLALFVIWAVLIAALAWMMERSSPELEDEA